MSFKNLKFLILIGVLLIIFTISACAAHNNSNDEVSEPASSKIIETETSTVSDPSSNVEPTMTPSIEEEQEEASSEIEYKPIEETSVESEEEQYVSEIDNTYNDNFDYELDLLARTIYQESGICGEYCQWLVGSTVLNLADERGGIEAVVFDYDIFNVAYSLYDDTPSELSYSVARRLMSGDRDYYVKAFRTDYFHSFGTPYTSVDNIYFSTY